MESGRSEEFVYFVNLSVSLWFYLGELFLLHRLSIHNNFSIYRCLRYEKNSKALIICLWILFGFRRRRRILIMFRKSIMNHYYYRVPLNESESISLWFLVEHNFEWFSCAFPQNPKSTNLLRSLDALSCVDGKSGQLIISHKSSLKGISHTTNRIDYGVNEIGWWLVGVCLTSFTLWH
jgi:hypothetical protein